VSRVYTVNIDAVAWSAAGDVLEIRAAAGRSLRLIELVLGQSSDYGDAAAEGLITRIKRGVGHTAGTGGAALAADVNVHNHPPGQQDPSFTGAVANAVAAVAGAGTLTTLRTEAWNVQAGYYHGPREKSEFSFASEESMIVSLSGPADEITLCGYALIEEF
jgi:hypothetical protein